MRIFVAGGTGAIGKGAVPALKGAGHDVTVLTRSPEKAAQVESQGATPARVGWTPMYPTVREGWPAVVRALGGNDG